LLLAPLLGADPDFFTGLPVKQELLVAVVVIEGWLLAARQRTPGDLQMDLCRRPAAHSVICLLWHPLVVERCVEQPRVGCLGQLWALNDLCMLQGCAGATLLRLTLQALL
jgi:hypothetical protein